MTIGFNLTQAGLIMLACAISIEAISTPPLEMLWPVVLIVAARVFGDTS